MLVDIQPFLQATPTTIHYLGAWFHSQSHLSPRDLVLLDLDIGRCHPLELPTDLDPPFSCGQPDHGVRRGSWRRSSWQNPCEGWLADPSATLLSVASTPLCERLQAQVLAALTQEVWGDEGHASAAFLVPQSRTIAPSGVCHARSSCQRWLRPLQHQPMSHLCQTESSSPDGTRCPLPSLQLPLGVFELQRAACFSWRWNWKKRTKMKTASSFHCLLQTKIQKMKTRRLSYRPVSFLAEHQARPMASKTSLASALLACLLGGLLPGRSIHHAHHEAGSTESGCSPALSSKLAAWEEAVTHGLWAGHGGF